MANKTRNNCLFRKTEYTRNIEALEVPSKWTKYTGCGFSNRHSDGLKYPQYRAIRKWDINMWSDTKCVFIPREDRTFWKKYCKSRANLLSDNSWTKKICKSEIDVAVFKNFIEDHKNEFAGRFKDFPEIEKLSPFLKALFSVPSAGEWSGVSAN